MFVSLIFVSCNSKVYYWEFEQDYANIKEIKIVNARDALDYDVVKELNIDLVEDLYKDISNIKMHRYGTNLSQPYGECFLIVYSNDEYDIISLRESQHVKFKNNKLTAYNSWLECDEETFGELIKKYLE